MGDKRGAIAAAAAALVLAGCAAGYSAENPSPLPPPVVPETAFAPNMTTPATSTVTVPPGAERVTVTRVIDGDTFEISGNRRIRVLGIDSCEIDTMEGRNAAAQARIHLDDPDYVVTLTEEPGVDTDRYGRELRYVQFRYPTSPSTPQDFGELMVGYAHTGVYEGDNDASDEYVAQLRSADVGRDCTGEDPTPTTTARDDGDTYVELEDDDDDRGPIERRVCRRTIFC